MTDALDASSEPNGSAKLAMDIDPPLPVDLEVPTLEVPKLEVPEAKPTLASLFDDDPPPPRPLSPDSAPRSRTGSYSVRFDLPEDEAGPSSPRAGSTSPYPYGSREGTPNGTVKRARGRSRGKASESPAPALVPELPLAWDEALETFETLERCVYERKDLGLSREQDEMMVCDCTYDPDDPDDQPCGHESDCINRIMFIECLAGECKAGKACRNQRLARRQYAPVDVVQTEKKGFGLRARENIPAGALVYEYIGEVVVEKTFRKRMAEYADEGIKHFYFMMLQKEEYIDATKKGGIGRFANHSCNPNCEVQKWVVGRRMRMGIFTKRDIIKDEEITFNYNVDRYGHEAQICYCGEPNCVGTIGGKTQTDIGGMDDLFLEALGILDEVNSGGMKGSRKKKARHLDEDYVPILTPIREPTQANKVSAAMRQSMENPTMMGRLIERVKLTEDPAVHRQLMRMHGFSLMAMILTSLADNREIVLMALQCMEKWRTQIRNKIEDSGIEEPIKLLASGSDEELASIAQKLLDYWSTLELSYRIPRRSKIASLDDDDERDTTTIDEANAQPRRHARVVDELANTDSVSFHLAPVRQRPIAPPVAWHRREPRWEQPPPPPPRVPSSSGVDRSKLDAIIALAAQTSAPATPTVPADEPRKRQKREHRERSSRERDREAEEAKKEKRLTKAIGEVVVRSMSKYKDQMEHDTFKRYAKDCTSILVEKEKRGASYQSHRHPQLSEEKKAKIKSFTKEFTHKVLRNLKAKGKLRKPSTSGASGGASSSGGSGASGANGAGGGGLGGSGGSSIWSEGSLATPALTAGSSTSAGTPNGNLLDEMFGEDDEHSVTGSGTPGMTPGSTPRFSPGKSPLAHSLTPLSHASTPLPHSSFTPQSSAAPLPQTSATPLPHPSVPQSSVATPQPTALPQQPVMQDRFVGLAKLPPTGPKALSQTQSQGPILVDRVANVRLNSDRDRDREADK